MGVKILKSCVDVLSNVRRFVNELLQVIKFLLNFLLTSIYYCCLYAPFIFIFFFLLTAFLLLVRL